MPNPGGNPQTFGLPRGVAFAPDRTVFVIDAVAPSDSRTCPLAVQRSSRMGTGVRSPATSSSPNSDIDVSKDLVLVADKENNRVQVVRVRGILNDTTDTRGE